VYYAFDTTISEEGKMYSIKKIEIDESISGRSIATITAKTTEMTMTLEIVAARIQQLETQMERALELLEDKETKPKGVKKAKAEKPKRRGTTGYILYSKTNRADVKAEMEGAKPTEVVTELAKRWKALSDEEREEWKTQAKVDVDFEAEMEK